MGNPLELQQCEALTLKGVRCKRKGIKKAVRTAPESFLFFFVRTAILPVFLCSSHYEDWVTGEAEHYLERDPK